MRMREAVLACLESFCSWGLSIHGEFSKARISELQHKEANRVHAWSLSCCY